MELRSYFNYPAQSPPAFYAPICHLGVFMKIAICAMLTVGYMSADAAPLRWNLDGVTFPDGGSANGSFVYDADTGMYSDIGINTTAGAILGGATYLDVVGSGTNGFRVVPDAALAD